MVNLWLFGTVLISFFITLIALPQWIKQAHKNGLVGKDMQKLDKREVAEAGGVTVLLGTALGILAYIAVDTFIFNNGASTLELIFALLSVLLISAGVGLIDDLLGWKKGLSKKVRMLVILFAAVPLMVVNAGNSVVMGINLGLLYPLLVIPIGVVGATTTFNFLEGWNGLGTKQGILILSALAFVTYMSGTTWLSLICLIMVASLLAFYLFNKYPSKVFPGDVLTYSIGAMIAAVAILGGVEEIALLLFIPYLIEVILKLRGGLKKESFAKLNEDGSLNLPYNKVYSLTHLSLVILKKIKPSHKVYERDVVNLINGFQLVIIILTLIITKII